MSPMDEAVRSLFQCMYSNDLRKYGCTEWLENKMQCPLYSSKINKQLQPRLVMHNYEADQKENRQLYQENQLKIGVGTMFRLDQPHRVDDFSTLKRGGT